MPSSGSALHWHVVSFANASVVRGEGWGVSFHYWQEVFTAVQPQITDRSSHTESYNIKKETLPNLSQDMNFSTFNSIPVVFTKLGLISTTLGMYSPTPPRAEGGVSQTSSSHTAPSDLSFRGDPQGPPSTWRATWRTSTSWPRSWPCSTTGAEGYWCEWTTSRRWVREVGETVFLLWRGALLSFSEHSENKEPDDPMCAGPET